MSKDRVTQLLHLENQDVYCAMSMPIYQASTFRQDHHDKENDFEYSRVQNPTRKYLEMQLAILDGADAAFAVTSGLSALNTVLSMLNAYDELIIGKDFYAGLSFILEKISKNYKICIKQIDLQDPALLEKTITSRTKMVLCETLSNPLQKITPIAALAKITKKHAVYLVVDNSLMSSYSFLPLEHGADIAIQSSTKYLSGHGDITAGVLATHEKFKDKIFKIIVQMGVALDPFQSWLLSRSLKTIHLRMDRISKNTRIVYQFLKDRNVFKNIYYAGDLRNKHASWLIKNSISLGGILTIECFDEDQFNYFCQNLKLFFSKTVSFGSIYSSFSHPATMSHKDVEKLQQIQLQVSPWLLRLSIGCESLTNILAVFQQFIMKCS